jgi:ankyrin repeat protein
MHLVEKVIILVKRGCSPNEESPRGITPLLCLVMNEASVEQIQELLLLKANINYVNKFGITPLMLACKLNDTKMIHVLMKNGAVALQKGNTFGLGRTAL